MTVRSTLLLLFAASCSSTPPFVRVPTGDLQPLEVGLEWTYESEGGIQTTRVTGTESVGRFECRVVESRTGDRVVRQWMRWDRQGLKVHRLSDGERTVEFDDPILLIHRFASPGATWSFEERHGPVTLQVDARYVGDDGIALKGRIIPSARIHMVKRLAGRVVVDQTSHYAKDIGLMRHVVVETFDDKETRTTLQLNSCNFLAD